MNTNKNPLLSGELPIDGKQARSNRILKQFHQKLPFLGQEVKLCEKILRQTTVSIRLQFRCKIVLEAQTCSSIKELKERLGIKSYNTICLALPYWAEKCYETCTNSKQLKGYSAYAISTTSQRGKQKQERRNLNLYPKFRLSRYGLSS